MYPYPTSVVVPGFFLFPSGAGSGVLPWLRVQEVFFTKQLFWQIQNCFLESVVLYITQLENIYQDIIIIFLWFITVLLSLHPFSGPVGSIFQGLPPLPPPPYLRFTHILKDWDTLEVYPRS